MFIDKENTGLGAVGNLFLILLITSHMAGMNLLPPALSFSYIKQEHSGDHSETFTIPSYFKFYAFFKFQSVLKLQDSFTLWEMQVFTVRNNLGSQIWLAWKGLILAILSMWPMTTNSERSRRVGASCYLHMAQEPRVHSFTFTVLLPRALYRKHGV